MAVDRRGRYARTGRVPWTRADGSAVELLAPTARPDPPTSLRHRATDTDRLDVLADRYYRDARTLWRIADAAASLDPFDVVVAGESLAIPPAT